MTETLSLKQRILMANDIRRETVFVPDWNLNVYVKTLTGAERDAWESTIMSFDGKKTRMNIRNMRARLVVMCIVDESGNRIFSDAEAEVLGQKSAAALDRLYAVAQRLNAVSDADMEELEKNLAIIPSDDSGSA
jgi:hypothetical protein